MASPFKKSIENIYNKMINYAFVTSFITAIIGLVLLFLPEISNKIVGIVAGISFIFTGISAVFNYFQRNGAKIYMLNIIYGIIFAIIGVVLIVFPYRVMQFVTICLGLFLLINGLMKINHAFWLRRGSEDCWLVTLVSGILLVVFAVMIFINPFKANLTLTQIVGVFVLINGILDFMNTFMYKRRSKEIIDIFW